MVLLSHALNAGVSNLSLKGISLISSVYRWIQVDNSLSAMMICRMDGEICYEDFRTLCVSVSKNTDAKTMLSGG